MSADLTAAEALPSTRDAVENQFALLVATDFREPRKTLSNVLTSEELTRRYAEALGNPNDIAAGKNVAANPLIRGAAQFIIFHYTAIASDTPDRRLLDAISLREEFRDFIIKFYDIPSEIELAKLSFHMAGTTSFIFKVQTVYPNPLALKLIQAPFINLQGIRVATSGYRERFGIHVRYSPTIIRSEPTWILMDFIDGVNLSQFLQTLRQKEKFLSNTYIDNVCVLFHRISEALAYYEQHDIVHGDLTPFNILVEGETERDIRVKLIDFGVNYVLKDRAGSRRGFTEAFSRAELFTAPEVVRGKNDASKESDLYSLGKIGLELLSDEPLRQEIVGSN